jgi:Dodecin
MSNHTYSVIEIAGTSPDGIDAATRNGPARAAETTRGLDWFRSAIGSWPSREPSHCTSASNDQSPLSIGRCLIERRRRGPRRLECRATSAGTTGEAMPTKAIIRWRGLAPRCTHLGLRSIRGRITFSYASAISSAATVLSTGQWMPMAAWASCSTSGGAISRHRYGRKTYIG